MRGSCESRRGTWVEAIEGFKGGNVQRGMNVVVVYELNSHEVLIPGFIEVGKVVTEGFDDCAVCVLNKALGLWMICCA